ncbi:MAG: prephenate dehydratase [Cyclobacteriaceae bacterium]
MNLEELRDKIDSIDDQLLKLLNERMKVVHQVGELKRGTGSSIYRPEREKAIIQRLIKQSDGRLTESAIEAIFLEIFAVSRNFELPERVVFLGPEGSFTHQAAESRYGAMSDYLPVNSISSVFETVNSSRAKYGVVPIENNQEGIVEETLDLLGHYNLQIVAELSMPIHFSFATKQDDVKKIKKIYSKDIAFRQCRKFIRDLFGDNVELIPVNSTSTACKQAILEEDSAAICSHIAAREVQLPILFDNIEDSADNHTRFLILSKGVENATSGDDKTSVVVRLQGSDKPGALVRFLQDFDKAKINLSKIESRPAKNGTDFKYVFYIDFEAHWKDDQVQKIIKAYGDSIKWLGSYPKTC